MVVWTPQRWLSPFVWGGFVLWLIAGCGGGSGSTSSLSLGGDQDPDPVVQDFPIAYVKRPLLLDDNGDLLTFGVRDAVSFMPGATLYARDRASPSAPETLITDGIFPDDVDGNPPLYDVKDLSPSFDGLDMVFAMRAPEDPNVGADEQPTWNIWVYHFETAQLNRVISSDTTAEDGQDVAPRFLPDGRIVFSSTRQRRSKAILLDEGKPQFAALDEDRNEEALTLHVMDDDGADIHQVSFNQSSDLDPAVLSDGRVVYSRWDDVSNIDRFSLYSMNPDGTDQHLLYGVHSHDTGPNGESIEFMEPQEMSDGRTLVSMRPSSSQAHLGASLVAIDTQSYTDHDQPTFANQGLLADAQEVLVSGEFTLNGTPSPEGRFASVYPLDDGTDRVLVTWSQCRLLDPLSDPLDPTIIPCDDTSLQDPAIQEAPPLYGVWMFDRLADTQLPIVTPEEDFAYTEAIVLEDRLLPPVILDRVAGIDLDPDLVSEAVGTLHIRSVYDLDGTALVDIPSISDPTVVAVDQRPARFLRIVKSVSIPDDDIVDLDGTAFGVSAAQLMREIIGYAPIEPDGSVKVKVPANIPFWISVLDVDGRRITGRHQNWMQVRPGEEVNCNGCHEDQSQLPHGRPDAEAPSVNDGAPLDGQPFPNTNPALFADAGETMAETATRINGIPDPDVDIAFVDIWTDPAETPAASFDYSYAALQSPSPVDPACVTTWTANCRIVINYLEHIQPIWEAPRLTLDALGMVIADDTCTTCHNAIDAMGAAQEPAGRLDLTGGPSPQEADHVVSYQELLAPGVLQVLDPVTGALVVVMVPELDANGDPVFVLDPVTGLPLLDIDGNPIPVLVPVSVAQSMSPAGALASQQFFTAAGNALHAGLLSTAELKLISEWLDIGAQYYNDPFAVPQN
jgi:hypothetical protein